MAASATGLSLPENFGRRRGTRTRRPDLQCPACLRDPSTGTKALQRRAPLEALWRGVSTAAAAPQFDQGVQYGYSAEPFGWQTVSQFWLQPRRPERSRRRPRNWVTRR